MKTAAAGIAGVVIGVLAGITLNHAYEHREGKFQQELGGRPTKAEMLKMLNDQTDRLEQAIQHELSEANQGATVNDNE